MIDTHNPHNTKQHTNTQRILTGITTSGIPHLGNYVGAIRPAITAINNNAKGAKAYFFLADLHALIKCHNPKAIAESTKAIAATWLACGLDPEKVVFYRQSDIPEIPELAWILACNCSKGLMNRAHAYKAMVDNNLLNPAASNSNLDPDFGISMGLFSYPVLMAADILMFNATHVPVGKDQIQHIEMARDIAGTFNFRYSSKKPLFALPEAMVNDDTPLLTGLDGRKMSKSYGNTIPLFGDDHHQDSEKILKKAIMRIVTNSQLPGEAKDPNNSINEIYQAFTTPAQAAAFKAQFAAGIGWGEAKETLFKKINDELMPYRQRYIELMNNPNALEEILQMGANKARQESRQRLAQIRQAIGIYSLAN